MLSVQLNLLDVEMNGVGCVAQSMTRSGELGIKRINSIVLTTHEMRIEFGEYFCDSIAVGNPLRGKVRLPIFVRVQYQISHI